MCERTPCPCHATETWHAYTPKLLRSACPIQPSLSHLRSVVPHSAFRSGLQAGFGCIRICAFGVGVCAYILCDGVVGLGGCMRYLNAYMRGMRGYMRWCICYASSGTHIISYPTHISGGMSVLHLGICVQLKSFGRIYSISSHRPPRIAR